MLLTRLELPTSYSSSIPFFFFCPDKGKLCDGYAPFCKHVFVPNFLGLPVQAVAVTDENRHLVQSGYVRRTPKELPVLSRWISESSLETVPVAKMLDVILYSREQIVLERVAQGDDEKEVEAELPRVKWGIISIKAQDESHEIPMQVSNAPPSR